MCYKSVSILTCSQLSRINLLNILSSIIEAQTYDNIIEWIIVNGCIDDKEHDSFIFQVNKFINQKCKIVLVSDKYITKTIGAFRNLGNRAATGDIIVCMDDDDFYFPTYIQTCVHSLSSNLSYDVAGCSGMLMYDIGLNIIYKLKTINKFHTLNCCIAYRNSYGRTHFYDENIIVGEEKGFLNNFSTKIIQMPFLKCIIHMCYSNNTFSNKRFNIISNIFSPVKIYYETSLFLPFYNKFNLFAKLCNNIQYFNYAKYTDIVIIYGNIYNNFDPSNYTTLNADFNSIFDFSKSFFNKTISIYAWFNFNVFNDNNITFYNLRLLNFNNFNNKFNAIYFLNKDDVFLRYTKMFNLNINFINI